MLIFGGQLYLAHNWNVFLLGHKGSECKGQCAKVLSPRRDTLIVYPSPTLHCFHIWKDGMHPTTKINPGKRKINDTTPWPKSLDTICFHGLACPWRIWRQNNVCRWSHHSLCYWVWALVWNQLTQFFCIWRIIMLSFGLGQFLHTSV